MATTSAPRPPQPSRSTPLVVKLIAPLLVIATLVVGLWFFSGVIAPDYTTSIIVGVAWFIVASVIFGKVGKTWPDLRWPVRGTFLACSVAALVAFYLTSVRDKEVNEKIVTGVPASKLGDAGATGGADPLAPQTDRGRSAPRKRAAAPRRNVVTFRGTVQAGAHAADGTAQVIELGRGGRRLTLSNFEIDPGPMVKVYLSTDSGADDFEDLGGLKGNKGNQQYTIPNDVNLSKYDTVVFWCVPFSQSLGHAELKAA